jgi:hypothetical protein
VILLLFLLLLPLVFGGTLSYNNLLGYLDQKGFVGFFSITIK